MASSSRISEWDVLEKHHQFVRDDKDDGVQGAKDASWEERLARAYESKLFREYALVDLKHYKSKRFALRWRTATEVVNGIGEETCGSLRCEHHSHSDRGPRPALRAFELPFVYEEHGERKECLVKVRLCRRCAAKLEWKPERDNRNARLERSAKEGRRGGGEDERRGDGRSDRDGDSPRARHHRRRERASDCKAEPHTESGRRREHARADSDTRKSSDRSRNRSRSPRSQRTSTQRGDHGDKFRERDHEPGGHRAPRV